MVVNRDAGTTSFPVPVVDERKCLPYPNGWFAVCFSHELKPGTVLTVRFMGRELVVYRTSAEEVCVIDPHCPHLGAHLGHGGKIDGDNLVCPFHGLAFASNGVCIRDCNGQAPPRAALHKWISHERNGMVMVWHDRDGRAPEWEIAEIDATGFSSVKYSQREMQGFPHDLAENSADAAHFAWLHGFTEVEMNHVAGYHWITSKMKGRWRGTLIHLKLTAYGLGHVHADIEVPDFGMKMETRAFSTPTGHHEWTFRWTDIIRFARFDALPTFIRKPLYDLILWPTHYWILLISSKDFPVWAHRAYIRNPKFMASDASLAAFRRWMVQFYPASPDSSDATTESAAVVFDRNRCP